MDGKPKTILACPLEWGLGHTVRLVPFIREAVRNGDRVILASDGNSLDFLRFHFPELDWIRMPFYPVRYPDNGKFIRKLLLQIPGILRAISRNHRQVGSIVSEYQIDEILSDHRYGLYHKNVHSIFITNQLWLKAPKGWRFGEGLAYRIHSMVLSRFSEIWIADYPGTPNLSGLLTHPPHLPARAKYVGPVSRFQGLLPVRPENAEPFEVLALVSGPEPQRGIFENLLCERFRRQGTPAVLFRGVPPSSPDEIPSIRRVGTVLLIDHACDEHLLWYILNAENILCRPGNSTLSDLLLLGKKAILVPTPGQTEQEYVAGHLEKQGLFTVCRQEEL
jgi:hypothetical protein